MAPTSDRSIRPHPHAWLRRLTRQARLFVVLAAAGCQETPETPEVPQEAAFMRGRITKVDGPGGYLVEGTPSPTYRVDRAYFTVGPATALLRRDGRAATEAELLVGQPVSLWITGTIRESYPVQVEARTVVLELDAATP